MHNGLEMPEEEARRVVQTVADFLDRLKPKASLD